jgi:hypothetical protein
MQLFTDYTQENLNNESDPLFLLCYPVSKLQFISDVLESFEDSGSTPFLNFHKSTCFTIGQMIQDCIKEINAVIDAANHHFNKLQDENEDFAEKLKLMMPAYDLAQSVRVTQKNG